MNKKTILLLVSALLTLIAAHATPQETAPAEPTKVLVDATAEAIPFWNPRPEGVVFVQTPEGARLISLVQDPGFATRLAAEKVASVEIEMKSTGGGKGEIFWFRMLDDGNSLFRQSFLVEHDGEWHTYRVELPEVDDLKMLRIDPSVEPGEQTIRSIRLMSTGGMPIKEWIYADSQE